MRHVCRYLYQPECRQRCSGLKKIHSLALLPFPCDAFAATLTTKKNLENPDGRWLLSWKAKATCLPQLNYNAAQPEWRLNRIQCTFLWRVCRYLQQCKNQLRSLAKRALLIWFPLLWTRRLCRLWWTTTIMITKKPFPGLSVSLRLRRGCFFVDSSIKWFIVGCACKVLLLFLRLFLVVQIRHILQPASKKQRRLW